jgi:hypothetical protein
MDNAYKFIAEFGADYSKKHGFKKDDHLVVVSSGLAYVHGEDKVRHETVLRRPEGGDDEFVLMEEVEIYDPDMVADVERLSELLGISKGEVRVRLEKAGL